MKHLDEGTLQAWLDMPRSGLDASEVAEIEGHLAVCEACAAELEALRGSDGSVHTLLAAGLDRDIERPPFEEVVARAEGRTAGGGMDARRGLSRLNRIAWAASIVVALGVGWLTNEIYRAGPPNPTGRAPVAPASEPEAQIGAEASSQAPAETSDAVDSEPARAGSLEEAERVAQPAAPPPSVAADVDVPASSADAAAGAGGAGAPSTPEPDGQPSLRYERQRALADDTSRDDFAGIAAQPEPAAQRAAADEARLEAYQDSVATSRPVVRGVVRDSASGEPVASAQVFVEDLNVGSLTEPDGSYTLFLPPGDSLDLNLTVQRIGYRTQTREVDVSSAAPAIADFTLQEEALLLQEVVVTGDVGRTQRRALGNTVERLDAVPVYDWQPDTRESVEAELGGTLLTVPGFEVLSIESVEPEDPGVDVLVRIRQAIGEDGGVLTLVEGRSDESRDAWPVASEGAVASTRRDELLVTGTAALAPEYLRELLDSLRQDPPR